MNHKPSKVASLMGALCLSGLITSEPVSAASADTLDQNFLNPNHAVRPWVRWWWPGGAVQDNEIRREIDLLDTAGFGGAEIQPFNPGITNLSPDERASINDYATPSFLAHVRAAAEEAHARGLKIDYTFGSGWPSGGGFAITPELALVELTVARTAVPAGAKAPFSITLPPRSRKLGAISVLDARTKDPAVADWSARMDARQKIIAVIAVKATDAEIKPEWKPGGFKLFGFGTVVTRPGQIEDGSAIVLTDKLRADGQLDWSPPPGNWQVLTFKQYAVNSGVFAGVGAGPQLVLDHFKQEAFEAHARHVGDPLIDALGSARGALRATFVDSLELMQDLYWSEDFLEQFKARQGYDLTPFLPLILQPGWMAAWDDHYSAPVFEMGDTGERVRSDYEQTVSDLMMERFVNPFVQWNHEHGIKARFQAHGGPLDLLKAYGAADIPETEDLYEFAEPHFLRLARSAADIYGRPLVSAESLVWKDRPYSVTPEEMRQRADLLYASGVNELVLHGFPYTLHPERWPGWHAFEPSGFQMGFSTMLAETNPIWMAVPTLAGYIGRTQSVLQSGRNVVPVALFFGAIGYFKGIEDGGAGRNELKKSLLSAGYDYDRVNDDALASASIKGGKLVMAGGAEFSALIVPPIEAIHAETAERIAEFAKQGLTVVLVDAAPSREKGYYDHIARDQRVTTAMASALDSGARVVPLATVADTVRQAGVRSNLRFTGDGTDLLFIEKDVAGRAVYFLHNPGQQSRDASFDTTVAGVPERWDAWTGGIEVQSSSPVAGGTHVALQLDPGQSALVVFRLGKARKPTSARPNKLVGELTVASSGWKLHATGHGVGGRTIDVTLPTADLGDWRGVKDIEDLAGIGDYRHPVEVEHSWLKKGIRVTLDLGEIHDVARVTLNGRTFVPVFGARALDVTAALHPGSNALSVEVANSPNNALIDAKLPGYKSLKPVPAGLVGPVTFRASR